MRARAKWETVDTIVAHGKFDFQRNNYNEERVLYNGKVFRTFNGYDKFRNAKKYWENLKRIYT